MDDEERRRRQREYQRRYRERMTPEKKAELAERQRENALTDEFRARRRAYLAENPEIAEAGREATRRWAADPENANRRRERRKAIREADRERFRAYSRDWRAKNPERAKELIERHKGRRKGIPTLSAQVWWDLLVEFDHACAYCGATDKPLGEDHVIPLIRGGANDLSNIVPCCKTCNSRKSDNTLAEWLGFTDRRYLRKTDISDRRYQRRVMA